MCLLHGGVLFLSCRNLRTSSFNLASTIVASLAIMETLAYTVVVWLCQPDDGRDDDHTPLFSMFSVGGRAGGSGGEEDSGEQAERLHAHV